MRLPRPRLGVRFTLPLRGHFHLFSAPLDDRAIDCELSFSFHGMRRSVLHREGTVEGHVTAERLARGRKVRGEVTYREASEGQVLVTVRFTADGDGEAHVGEEMTLRGFVEVLPVAPLVTATTMPMSLYSAHDREIGRGVLRFDLRSDLIGALRSLRPSLRVLRGGEGGGGT